MGVDDNSLQVDLQPGQLAVSDVGSCLLLLYIYQMNHMYSQNDGSTVNVLWSIIISIVDIIQSINQYIYKSPWYRGACYSADYAEAKRNVLSRVLNVSTDGAVRQFRGSEFQSLGALLVGSFDL